MEKASIILGVRLALTVTVLGSVPIGHVVTDCLMGREMGRLRHWWNK